LLAVNRWVRVMHADDPARVCRRRRWRRLSKPRTRTLTERKYGWWVKKRGRLRAMFVWWTIIPITLTGVGYSGIRSTLIDMPARYSSLEHRGVAAAAVFAGCDDRECRLRLSFRGRMRTWNYDADQSQFRQMQPGDSVAVIVDPRRVETTYTALDVKRRTNAGFGVLFIFSALAGLTGLVGFCVLWVFGRATLREWDRGGRPMGLPSPKQAQHV
jgi:hypothetical protein